MATTGRNDPCPCGSGKKYKKCCLIKEQARPPVASGRLLEAVGFHQTGQIDKAEAIYRELLAKNPKDADALHYLGLLAHQTGDYQKAADLIEEAIECNDSVAAYFCNLGNAYRRLNRIDDAIAALVQALNIDPNSAAMFFNLGQVCVENGDEPSAAAAFQRAVTIDASFAEGWLALGDVKLDQELIDDALDCYDRAIAIRGDMVGAHLNRAVVLQRFGQVDEAIRCYERVDQLDPTHERAFEDRLLATNFRWVDPQDIFDLHLEWARRFGNENKTALPVPDVAVRSGRRVRVGYVSGDLRRHAMQYFIDPILREHDRSRFEVFCYYNYPREDDVTERLKTCSDHWVDCYRMTDSELSGKIIADGIDVLIDLSGHVPFNRLHVFAARSAPVQASMLGYLNTTGLKNIDYRITDEVASPPGMLEKYHTESIARLPHCQWCYSPDENSPAVSPAPAIANGYVTFGAFHNLAKITPELLEQWGRILDGVPDSRLVIVVWGKRPAMAIQETFLRRGIAPGRVSILDPMPHQEFLSVCEKIDIVLDSHPYCGGTTSFESLWMGVPLVTQTGQTATSRGGASILSSLGLNDWIADGPEDYVRIAVGAASDIAGLAALRASLRERMRSSPLMNAPDYVRGLEALYLRFLGQ